MNPANETERSLSACDAVLSHMVPIERQLADLAHELREHMVVSSVAVFRFLPTHGNIQQPFGTLFRRVGSDFGVSATLEDGAVVDWWFELWFDGTKWSAEAAIYRHDSDEDGSHVVTRLLDANYGSGDEATVALQKAALEAVNSRDALKASPPPT